MSTSEYREDQPTSSDIVLGKNTQGADLVQTEQRGSVWMVIINRPAVRNAIDGPTAQALTHAFQQFEREASLTIAVLTGDGGTFCSGADLVAVADSHRALPVAEEGDAPLGLARLLLSKPCLAAIEGYALGGGLELALWCDLRVAASDAVFGLAYHCWGIPSMDGATVLLPRLIGQSHAFDLLLTGRSIAAEEASAMGLVNRLVAPETALEATLGLAEEIARFPQPCLRADRRSCYEQWSLPYLDALHNEAHHSLQAIKAEETGAALRRFASRKER